jgi:hypothetical protein
MATGQSNHDGTGGSVERKVRRQGLRVEIRWVEIISG